MNDKKKKELKKLLTFIQGLKDEDIRCICGEQYHPLEHPLTPCVAKREWEKLNN